MFSSDVQITYLYIVACFYTFQTGGKYLNFLSVPAGTSRINLSTLSKSTVLFLGMGITVHACVCVRHVYDNFRLYDNLILNSNSIEKEIMGATTVLSILLDNYASRR